MEGIFAIAAIFIGLPWLIFHYITKWKTTATLTNDDEQLLSDLYETARRYEERIETIERIIAADNPDWRPTRLDDSRTDTNDPHRTLDTIRAMERNR
ncbi:MAG: envelope stress response membrane protein PspB [Novosphingopyxis baekryungensis]|jgi:phage shock protein B|uniref:envelope stress response membrane protein PspB n=1 Tax=Novosphingopyxis baekryungensis TaxID=279369 RepID=UPI0003B4746D|nr:envelope stress response membrane protein PspB [Novosphingopyxis baekryungensis]MDE0932162.1 envelope stress response membrane protein PspB [Novosphingopyxis baekryungensis]